MEERYPEKVRRRGFDSHRDHREMGAMFLAPIHQCTHGLLVKTGPFQGPERGSIPRGCAPLSLAEFRIPI